MGSMDFYLQQVAQCSMQVNAYGWLTVNKNSNLLFLIIGPGDLLVHHVIALAFRFIYNYVDFSKKMNI